MVRQFQTLFVVVILVAVGVVIGINPRSDSLPEFASVVNAGSTKTVATASSESKTQDEETVSPIKVEDRERETYFPKHRSPPAGRNARDRLRHRYADDACGRLFPG
jgi:hypothetical protein